MTGLFSRIYGMSSFPLTNSIIFQSGRYTTNQISMNFPSFRGKVPHTCQNPMALQECPMAVARPGLPLGLLGRLSKFGHPLRWGDFDLVHGLRAIYILRKISKSIEIMAI